MLVKEEIKKTIDEIEKKILYFCKLKGYNNGKVEIFINGADISIDYQPCKEKIK